MTAMTIIAAADGSALGNPGPAGWAWYIDDDTWAAGGWDNSTNNRGELTAVAELLESTAHRAEERLEILCDSQYVINSVTKWMKGWKKKGWKKSDGKPVLNVDLMQRIDAAMVGRDVHFEWVKGHAGHELNEAADVRARDAAGAYQRKEAPNHGPGFPGASGPVQADGATAAPVAPSTPEPAQEGLFDEPDEARVLALHRTLARAVGKLMEGDGKRARFLTRDAVVIPGVDTLPAQFPDARVEVGARSGTTVVTVARAQGMVATCTWDMFGDGTLVAVHSSGV